VSKPTIIITFFVLSLLAILTFSLSKSWNYFDKGINLSDEENTKEEIIEKETGYSDEILRESKVIWKNYVYYPSDLSTEEGSIGPNKILHHARNLTFINISNGKLHTIFEKKNNRQCFSLFYSQVLNKFLFFLHDLQNLNYKKTNFLKHS
jgi:hypothetical protein